MSLEHILLGLLRRPASGYDMKREFEQQQAHYWSANLAQIYPTLDRMERRGLLKSREEPSHKGPPRRVYTRTARGREALLGWLKNGPEVQSDRLSWLAQVSFLDELDPADREAFLRALKAEFQRHRAELEQLEAGWRAEDPCFPDRLDPPDLFAHFTLRLGLKKYATIAEWCDECLQRLQEASEAAGPSDRPKSGRDRSKTGN